MHLPRYVEVAAALRAEIAERGLKPGDALPTETQLTERFRVSRFTVREALRRLSAEGLVERRRGSGTVVADRATLRLGFPDTAALLQYAAASSFEILNRADIRLDAATARRLKREQGEPWHHIRGLRVMDGAAEPVALTDAYLHPRFADAVPKLVSGHEALFSQLARLAKLSVGKVIQEIEAVALGSNEAELLHVAPRSPALRILRHYLDSTGELAEISCSVHPGSRFSYTMTIDR